MKIKLKKAPFTKKEREVYENLITLWNNFCKLPTQHPSEKIDFCNHIHGMQQLLIMRVAQREFNKDFHIPVITKER